MGGRALMRAQGIGGLVSEGPHPELAERMHPFDKLIGLWSLDIRDIAADGRETRLSGTWHFFSGPQWQSGT